MDTRFLEVCIDGDVEDLVQLFEEIARRGETLGYEDLNCADNSGRVSFIFNMKLGNPRIFIIPLSCLTTFVSEVF